MKEDVDSHILSLIIRCSILEKLMIAKGVITAEELNAEAEKVTKFINDQAQKIVAETPDEIV